MLFDDIPHSKSQFVPDADFSTLTSRAAEPMLVYGCPCSTLNMQMAKSLGNPSIPLDLQCTIFAIRNLSSLLFSSKRECERWLHLNWFRRLA